MFGDHGRLADAAEATIPITPNRKKCLIPVMSNRKNVFHGVTTEFETQVKIFDCFLSGNPKIFRFFFELLHFQTFSTFKQKLSLEQNYVCYEFHELVGCKLIRKLWWKKH